MKLCWPNELSRVWKANQRQQVRGPLVVFDYNRNWCQFFALTRYLHERTPLRMRVSNGVQLSRQSIFFSCGSDSTIRKELYSAFRPTMLSNFIVFFSSSIWFFSLPRPWTANYARLRGDERKNFINLDDIANKPNLSQFQSLLIGLVGFKPAAN